MSRYEVGDSVEVRAQLVRPLRGVIEQINWKRPCSYGVRVTGDRRLFWAAAIELEPKLQREERR